MKQNLILGCAISGLFAAQAEGNPGTTSHPTDQAHSIPPGATSKRQSNRDKAAGKGVGKALDTSKFEAEGKRDVKVLLALEKSTDQERCKLFARIGAEFSPYGMAPKKEKAKKASFAPETEAYFDGWKKERDSDAVPKWQKATVTVRMAEARRVVNAYVVKGREFMDDLMNGEGSYHQKIGSLPTMTNRAPRPPKAEGEKGAAAVPQVDLSKEADAAKRAEVISHYSDREVQEIVGNVSEAQVIPMLAFWVSRARVSKSEETRKLAESVGKLLSKADAEHAKETGAEKPRQVAAS